MGKILLSLCIPTFNRAPILNQGTRKLLELPAFDSEVELVICDNCSTDETPAVVEKLKADFPTKNITYHRNASNVQDINFFEALNQGQGRYRKLLNDYTYIKSDGLEIMKSEIRAHDGEPCALFFSGSVMKAKKGTAVAHNADEMVKYMYHHLTWISNFGVWDSDIDVIKSRTDKWSTHIMQVYWILDFATTKQNCYIFDFKKKYGRVEVADSYRVPYNVFNILAKNYYDILYSYRDQGLISDETIKKDKTNSLKTFVGWCIRDLLIRKVDSSYETEEGWKICWDLFKTCPYFYFIFIKAIYKSFICLFKKQKF